jgi:hypothetical protein
MGKSAGFVYCSGVSTLGGKLRFDSVLFGGVQEYLVMNIWQWTLYRAGSRPTVPYRLSYRTFDAFEPLPATA